MEAKQFLLISRRAPYGTSAARDLLDIALTCSVFEQNAALLLIGDGVLQLLPHQQPEQLGQKSLNALQASLPFYDLDTIYVDQDSLDYHQLEASALAVEVIQVDAQAQARLLQDYDVILTV